MKPGCQRKNCRALRKSRYLSVYIVLPVGISAESIGENSSRQLPILPLVSSLEILCLSWFQERQLSKFVICWSRLSCTNRAIALFDIPSWCIQSARPSSIALSHLSSSYIGVAVGGSFLSLISIYPLYIADRHAGCDGKSWYVQLIVRMTIFLD